MNIELLKKFYNQLLKRLHMPVTTMKKTAIIRAMAKIPPNKGSSIFLLI